jgi:hypothetical protein
MVVLICALVLLLDLADDGHLGKVKFVAPLPAVKSLEAASENPESGKVDCQDELLLSIFLVRSCRSQSQPSTSLVRNIRKIIISFHPQSAGGLPW